MRTPVLHSNQRGGVPGLFPLAVTPGGVAALFEQACLGVVRKLGSMIESADQYTFGHSARVAAYAVSVARALALDAHDVAAVYVGAYLHDLGKVLVPREILNKPGRLTAAERAIIRTHPGRGVELVSAIELPWDIRPMILWHHERYDGRGYPDRLCGLEIPIGAQIISIADMYDALTSSRSYRPAIPPHEACVKVRAERRRWHPDVYGAFGSAVIRGAAHAA